MRLSQLKGWSESWSQIVLTHKICGSEKVVLGIQMPYYKLTNQTALVVGDSNSRINKAEGFNRRKNGYNEVKEKGQIKAGGNLSRGSLQGRLPPAHKIFAIEKQVYQ